MWQVDRRSSVSICEQLVTQMEQWIAEGVYPPQSMLPSVRILSQELSVNPNTLQKAFGELERRGLCFSVPGNGRFVSDTAPDALAVMRKNRLKQFHVFVQTLKQNGITCRDMHAAIDEEFGVAKEDNHD